MKRVFLAVAAAVSLFVIAPAASATDDPPTVARCDRPVQVEGVADAELVVDEDGRCRPQPGDQCWRDGLEGRIDRLGRCICLPPTTTTPPTTVQPPATVLVPVPGPQGPPGQSVVQVVEVPTERTVVERTVVVTGQARPAVAVAGRPSVTG